MSELQKRIGRIQRRESPRTIGFGAASREQPRAMLLAVRATDAASARAALEAGADAVLVEASDARAAAAVTNEVGKKACVGAKLPALDEAGARTLRASNCDFAVSALETTASAAMDTEHMGQVLAIADGIDDTTLRALGPFGLDALYVEQKPGPMTLAGQLALVRMASFAASPLLVTIGREAAVGELRVLRDAGAAGVVAPPGTSPAEIGALIEALKQVPPPRKQGREGQDMALVPSRAAAAHDEDEEEEDEGD